MLTAGFLGESLLWGPGVFGLLPPLAWGHENFPFVSALGMGNDQACPSLPLRVGGLVAFRPPITLGGGRSIHFG